MTPEELLRWENEIFTRIVIDELKRQKAAGKTDFLLDKYEIDRQTKTKLKALIGEESSISKSVT